MDEAARAAVCGAAVKAAQAVGYVGAGTVEFIADASEGLRADRIWFMEMNTRLQVEHPVTEMVTGQDLVEWQLLVASGESLPLEQHEITLDGWAMEARLYAENPATGFLPSTGPLTHFRLPEGDVRIDSAVEEGGEVTPFYDPMIAKLIAHGVDREDAAQRLAEACRLVEVYPVKTNAAFLARCASDPDFVAGAVDTGFIEARLEDLTAREFSDAPTLAAIGQRLEAFMEADQPRADVWASAPSRLLGFRHERAARRDEPAAVGGRQGHAAARGPGRWRGRRLVLGHHGRGRPAAGRCRRAAGARSAAILCTSSRAATFASSTSPTRAAGRRTRPLPTAAILSPMPGKVVSVAVEAGDSGDQGPDPADPGGDEDGARPGRAVRRRGRRAVGRGRRRRSAKAWCWRSWKRGQRVGHSAQPMPSAHLRPTPYALRPIPAIRLAAHLSSTASGSTASPTCATGERRPSSGHRSVHTRHDTQARRRGARAAARSIGA